MTKLSFEKKEGQRVKHEGYNEFRPRRRFDFPIEFHHVDHNHPRFHMPYHWHIEYEIVYIVRGGLTLSLNEDVVTAGLTPNYFCRFFRKITHRSPIDYLNYYRIEAACIRLAQGDESITEIALATGFNDISYFIKTFRRYKGISPLKYQKGLSAVS